MRVFGVLFGALIGAAVITTSVGAAPANPSTITSVDVARVRPVGTYAGLLGVVLAVSVGLFLLALIVFGRLEGNFAEEL